MFMKPLTVLLCVQESPDSTLVFSGTPCQYSCVLRNPLTVLFYVHEPPDSALVYLGTPDSTLLCSGIP